MFFDHFELKYGEKILPGIQAPGKVTPLEKGFGLNPPFATLQGLEEFCGKVSTFEILYLL